MFGPWHSSFYRSPSNRNGAEVKRWYLAYPDTRGWLQDASEEDEEHEGEEKEDDEDVEEEEDREPVSVCVNYCGSRWRCTTIG